MMVMVTCATLLLLPNVDSVSFARQNGGVVRLEDCDGARVDSRGNQVSGNSADEVSTPMSGS